MAAIRYVADPEEAVTVVELDGLSALFHAPSGTTHIVAPPAPEILAALRESPAEARELLGRLARTFALEVPPLDGEGLGWGGVSGSAPTFIDATPSQPSPIQGEGFHIDALHARLRELEIAGLVRRA